MRKSTLGTLTTILSITLSVANAQQPAPKDSSGAMHYTFSEKGFAGDLTISKISACEVKQELGCSSRKVYKLELTTADQQAGHTCEVSAVENDAARITTGSVIDATFSARVDEEAAPVSFSAKFDTKKAVLSGDPSLQSSFCGLNGVFFGTWEKR